jgi:hypothetical protein
MSATTRSPSQAAAAAGRAAAPGNPISPRLLASPAAPSPAASLSALNAQMSWVIQDALFGDLQASAAMDLTAAAAAAASSLGHLPTQLGNHAPICSPDILLPSNQCSTTQAGSSWAIHPSTLTGRPNPYATQQQRQALSLVLPSSSGGSFGAGSLPLASPAPNTPFVVAGAAPPLVPADSLPLPPSPPTATTSAQAAAVTAADPAALLLAHLNQQQQQQQQEQQGVADGVQAGSAATQQQQQEEEVNPQEAAAPITAAAAADAAAAGGAAAPTGMEGGSEGDPLLTTQEQLWEEDTQCGGDEGGGLDTTGGALGLHGLLELWGRDS